MTMNAKAAAEVLLRRMANNAAIANMRVLEEALEGYEHRFAVSMGRDGILAIRDSGEAELFQVDLEAGKLYRTMIRPLHGARCVLTRDLVASNQIEPGRPEKVELEHESLPGGRLTVDVQHMGESEAKDVRDALALLIS